MAISIVVILSLAINENWDPDVRDDMEMMLNRSLPTLMRMHWHRCSHSHLKVTFGADWLYSHRQCVTVTQKCEKSCCRSSILSPLTVQNVTQLLLDSYTPKVHPP